MEAKHTEFNLKSKFDSNPRLFVPHDFSKIVFEGVDLLAENQKLKTLNAELIEALERVNNALDNMWNTPGIVRPPERFTKPIVQAQKESFKLIQKAKGGE